MACPFGQVGNGVCVAGSRLSSAGCTALSRGGGKISSVIHAPLSRMAAAKFPWERKVHRTPFAVLAAALLAATPSAHGQAFPSKPIRVIIPFVAGGSSDIVGRAIGAKFQEFLGQPAVVENKPGANGAIAAEFVAKSDPDGYTILVGSIGVFSINAALFKDLRYHPVRDFAPISLAVTTPNVLITKPALEAKSMKELVDWAKKNPGKLSYCSSGTG